MRSMCALIDPRLMIEPPPASRIISATAWAAKKWCRTLTAIRSSHGLVHLGDLVPVVVGRVVDQHADRAELLGRSGDRRLQGGDVTHVTFGKERIGAIV